MKYCKFCQIDKSYSQFVKHPKTADGYSNKCKQCTKEYRKHYNKFNKQNILEYNIKYNKTYNKKWGKDNIHVIKWRAMLKRCIKHNKIEKKLKTEEILGYSYVEFKHHIESQFTEGMEWDNIHIDHKIPLTWFSPDTPLYIVNHLSNIQPLFVKENISKLNRFSHPVDGAYYSLVKEWIMPQYVIPNPTS